MTKKTNFLLLLFLMVLGTVNVDAQVRIGGSTPPHQSAILDLNFDSDTDTLGLLLPRVYLDSVSSSAPLPSHKDGLVVYNLTTVNGLNQGIYYNDGSGWYPVLSSAPVRGLELPIIFLRQPEFLWLGFDGELTDTLCFELAAEDKSQFTYQWYKRDPETLVSTPLVGSDAQKDTIIINSVNKGSYGISDPGKVYQFYCVVISGLQYGISGTGRVVFGPGVRLANGGWIKIANANLGAVQGKPLTDQIAYTPKAESSGEANDKVYDPTVYGDWYQWGRKKDGHQNRTISSTNTNSNYYGTTDGVDIGKLGDDGQIIDSEENIGIYGKFIQRNGGTLDWRQYPPEDEGNSAVSPANYWTWGNPVKGITNLDPCKEAGENDELGDGNWRVPTPAEWAQIQSNNTWVWSDRDTKGYEIKPAGANKPTALFLPAAGTRYRNGSQYSVDSHGYYWSSAVTSTNSYSLYFTSGSINVAYASSRSLGFTVRCVSEYWSEDLTI
jgi:hypothetical protein